MEKSHTTTGNKLTLGAIWLMALVPMAAAGLAYRYQLPVADGQVNRGELLNPVLPIEQWGGEAGLFTGHWTLLMKNEGHCDPQCEQHLAKLRSVHDALGRESDRVRVKFASPSLVIEAGIWVIDPQGNLVLRYSEAQLGEPLLQDLKRLLKVSKIG
ncbi:MAG: hypothetical protein GYB21_08920 [Oceanospirillales bacterium]|nr:hypothetical protein [Oceanospirillales bacterium]